MTAKEIADKKLFLFDLDGTLYLGDKLFPFTIPLLKVIKENGKRYMFMTNNSSKSAEDYVAKMQRLGIDASKEDFVTSAYATAVYLLKHHKNDTLYVMGTESLKNEFKEYGFKITENLSEVDCIVLGFDTELTFKKLDDVCKLLSLNKDMPYIATHPDLVCPTEYGSVPDCGCITEIIYTATKRKPKVIGKPEPEMALLGMEMAGVKSNETAVIGDRIYTDVRCGLNAGAAAVLVLSGETTREMLKESEIIPTAVLESCEEILEYLK